MSPERVIDHLRDPDLRHVVALVSIRDGDTYIAADATGSVRFRHGLGGTEILDVSGTNPLDRSDPDHLLGRHEEVATEILDPAEDHHPHAYDEIAQFFDSPCAPDVAVAHTPGHRYHGNAGEHGSFGVVQRRAPLIAAGPGVRADGWVDGHARMVDVAPTLAALAGCRPGPGIGRFGEPRSDVLLRRQDGRVVPELVDGASDERAHHVLAVLWDGVNANELHAAIDDGDAPTVAALVERGTALRGGVLASFPSLTLANHTTALTGVHPGHSGVLHNEWFDPATGNHHDLLDVAQMFAASDHLAPGVETVHEAVKRSRPDAWCGSTHEFADRGADYSTFRELRHRRPLAWARSGDGFARDEHWYRESVRYKSYTKIDETALRHALEFWVTDHPVPAFAMANFSLTDEASHEGGPHSDEARAAIRDSDARLARLLQAVERRGVLDRTAIVLFADHGMQTTDETNTDGYREALEAAGVAVRDVADGLLYLT